MTNYTEEQIAETAYARCTSSKCRAYTGRKLLGTRADAVAHWNKRADMDYREIARELAEALDIAQCMLQNDYADVVRGHELIDAALAKWNKAEGKV